MKTRALVLCAALVALGGCVEIEELLTLNADGSGRDQVRFIVDDQWDEMLSDDLRRSVPQGWVVLEDIHQPNGDWRFVIRRDFRQVSELDSAERRYEFARERDGLFHARYRLTIHVQKTYEGPVRYTTRVNMPAAVASAAGAEVRGREAAWNRSSLSSGTALEVSAREFELPSAAEISAGYGRWFDGWFYQDGLVYESENALWVRAAEGDARRLVNFGDAPRHWDAAGTSVVWATTTIPTADGRSPGAYWLSLLEDEPHALALGDQASGAFLSPDGERALFVRAMAVDQLPDIDRELLLAARGESAPVLVAAARPAANEFAPERIAAEGVRWSRDGHSFLFARQTRPSRLQLVNTYFRKGIESDSAEVELPCGPYGATFQLAAFSGDHLAMEDGSSKALKLCDVATGDTRIVHHNVSISDGASFSPDGRWLAYVAGDLASSEVWLAGVDVTEPRQLSGGKL